jgi:hypothetical protein
MALKVFQTQIGFYDSIVATNSQPHALRLWGVKQDLFKTGAAKPVDNKELTKAALEQPHTPLYRPLGSKERFAENPKLTGAQMRSAMKKR